MSSTITLSFIAFINLFLIPVIGLHFYSKQQHIVCKFDFNTLYKYALIAVCNYPFSRIVANMVEKILSLTVIIESSKYTLISLVSCMILVCIIIVLEKVLQIEFSIELRKPNVPKEEHDEK